MPEGSPQPKCQSSSSAASNRPSLELLCLLSITMARTVMLLMLVAIAVSQPLLEVSVVSLGMCLASVDDDNFLNLGLDLLSSVGCAGYRARHAACA